MNVPVTNGSTKGKIGVLIEDHFDRTEFVMFNDYFPRQGYEVVYLTHLWGQPELHFESNPEGGVDEVKATIDNEMNEANPADFAGMICIGAYATDRLRYEVKPEKGKPNQSPAVSFLRKVVATPNLKVGAICHGLWLFCADRTLLEGRRVTCAHNIICDVENAGGDVVFGDEGTADIVVDDDMITAKHPGVTEAFMDTFVKEIEKVGAA